MSLLGCLQLKVSKISKANCQAMNSSKKRMNEFDITTGTPPTTRLFGPGKNHVKGKPRYRRSILVIKPQNGEFTGSKSTFSLVFTVV